MDFPTKGYKDLKEDCPDIRNTKIIDVVNIFSQFNNNIDIADPVADPDEVRSELGINLKATKNLKKKNRF